MAAFSLLKEKTCLLALGFYTMQPTDLVGMRRVPIIINLI